ncbi:putative exosome complex subunit Rrp46 [Talaromyces proteolyticus]|uniref:Exosome complex subunit Rrp46 n=1 Tax=Talaromyces proteolyticus TaxID=1131652 RepID=A0AAD4PXD3_9EURO|nr:putative exosome complex subunit Rrp46 [Talaromyces proteolyticus]KAH8692598.1 putative exosome complex subunit Rrp46 [Talaromyces proteolyticus]
MAEPIASLSPLSRSDGSAAYNCPASGFQILAAVTGPVELPGRRDAQKPEEATLEVLVKPGTAQGAIGERYVEDILKTLLGRVVLGRDKGFPRRGIVITLLVLGGSGGGKIQRGESYLPILPALLHAALLALLSAAIPMSMTYTAVALAVTNANQIVRDPSPSECKTAKSLHTLAFSSKGHLLLNESQGSFDFDTWDLVYDRAYSICRGTKVSGADGDVAMGEKPSLESVIREVVEDKIYKDYAWAIDAA